MITTIIPALNEEEHIASVVNFAKTHPSVSEVIVIDDNSTDDTVKIARKNGAKVFTSSKLGKGTSMKEGILAASNDIVCFLDGDIDPYPADTIRLLTDPIISGEAEFVKSTFDRNAGRVTELVAKPLLSIFFPDLTGFSQPLSGMIAGRKSILQTVDFIDDYGVDVGILIDMHLKNVRSKEVKIGYLENKSKPWESLVSMSREVARAIIQKARNSGKSMYDHTYDDLLAEVRSRMESELESQVSRTKKLILFDMDNTLLAGRFIDNCAETFGFKEELKKFKEKEEKEVKEQQQINDKKEEKVENNDQKKPIKTNIRIK